MRLKVAAGAVIAVTFLTLSGCSSFELETGAMCCDQEMAVDSKSQTVHGSLWGFQWSDHTVEKCEEGCGLYRVEYSTNAFFLAASVLSLGLYVPQTVEWWCQVERRDDSDQEPFDPNETGDQESGQAPHGARTVADGRDSS